MLTTDILDAFKNSLLHMSSFPAVQYLKGRNIKWSSVEKFKLGYNKDKLDPRILPYFDNTIVIPCFDISGEVVGLFGRRIDEKEPKYTINAKYNKERGIFGLHQAKEAILAKNFVILVEGIFDTIMMHQCGFDNTIAAPGAGWMDIQLATISRYTQNVLVLFDNDSTGKSKSQEVMNRLQELGYYTSKVSIPEKYKDVDEFLRKDPEAITYLQQKVAQLSNN